MHVLSKAAHALGSLCALTWFMSRNKSPSRSCYLTPPRLYRQSWRSQSERGRGVRVELFLYRKLDHQDVNLIFFQDLKAS